MPKKSKVVTMPAAEPVNEYVLVRANAPVRGVPGNLIPLVDPSRCRHFVRAASEEEARSMMAQRFPKPTEEFAVIKYNHNVPPLKFAA